MFLSPLYHVTMILHCHWCELWSLDTDVLIILSIIFINNEKLLNANNIRIKHEFFRLLWDIVVFRLVAYLLNIICLKLRLYHPKFYLYNLGDPRECF